MNDLLPISEADRLLAVAVASGDLSAATRLVGAADTMVVAVRKAKRSDEEKREWMRFALRAQRVAGAMLLPMPKGGPNSRTLRELGLDHDTSSRWQKVARVPVDVFTEYLDEDEPTRAGLLSWKKQEPAETLDDWYTPRWMFDQLGVTFDIDVCAPQAEALRTVPARRYYTEHVDGLAQPWEGLIWCNPPYSSPAQWIERWADHPTGLILTHVSVGSSRMHTLWEAADAIRLFSGMHFERPNGESHKPYWMLQLAARGDVAVDAMKRMGPAEKASPVWTPTR